MGSKCFRPVNESRQPVFLNCLQHAFDDANHLYLSKKSSKASLLEDIIANEHRKGNLKKLFDHLNTHLQNFLPAMTECNKRTFYDSNLPIIAVNFMFCDQLFKFLSSKKQRSSEEIHKTRHSKDSSKIKEKNPSKLKDKALVDWSTLQDSMHEIQSNFFELVSKILVCNKEKNLKNRISEIIIQYSSIFESKISAQKQLKVILDLYLTVVFEKNLSSIDKNSFLPFYAYSTLLSKSKTDLFTSDFIEKHFNFILKLFFELQDTKNSNRSITETSDFKLFQESVQQIVVDFLNFSSDDKVMKKYILREIMLQEDAEKFNSLKTMKLQRLISSNLESYSEHFMFDWLGYLLKYIGKSSDNCESIRDFFMDSLQQIQLPKFSSSLNQNTSYIESKVNAIETLKRWFEEKLLGSKRSFESLSYRIFEVLLLSLYNPEKNNEEVVLASKQAINYFLNKSPKKLTEILIIVNNQLRRTKNHSSNSIQNTSVNRKAMLIDDETAEGLWKNDIDFINQKLSNQSSKISLNIQEVEQIYAPLFKISRPSINIVYLIELNGIFLKYVDLKNQQIQIHVYEFLTSLAASLKISESEIELDFVEKFFQKAKFFFSELNSKNEPILETFLKFCFKNLFKEQKRNQLWTMIFVLIILVHLAIEESRNRNSAKAKSLNKCLSDVLEIIRTHKSNPQMVNRIYSENKELFNFSERMSFQWQKIKLTAFEHFEMSNESIPKSMSNVERSVLSSKAEVSDSNPDIDFKNIYQMIFTK